MSDQNKTPETLSEDQLNQASGGLTGGISVAVGDLNGDGVSASKPKPKPPAGPGGGPHVKAFD